MKQARSLVENRALIWNFKVAERQSRQGKGAMFYDVFRIVAWQLKRYKKEYTIIDGMHFGNITEISENGM